MFENIENLKIISALRKHSKPMGNVMGRGSSGFNIRAEGRVEYTFKDRQITVEKDEVIFIPKGTEYTYKTTEGSLCVTINIEGDFPGTKPFVCSLKDFGELEFFYNSFGDLWRFGTLSDKCQCISRFYSFLAFIANSESQSYGDKRRFDIIEPAVSYLKENIFNTDLKAESLHLLCGISNTYFREIFFLRFKTSPKEYIISKRISHAKSIIDSGDFTSVRELALWVGYKDPLYFGKAFKKIYGTSPSVMNK